MTDPIVQPEATARTRPVTWLNLPYWAYRTAVLNRRTYQPKHRPLSARRLGRALLPNLRRPIFVVGAPRSGTTFLGSCLGELPEISYHFEPVATKEAVRHLHDGQWGFVRGRWFFRNVYAWLMRIHLDGDLRFAEKTPRNAFILPFLFLCFPDASFIHIIRDGRDVALSLTKKGWLEDESEGADAGSRVHDPRTSYRRFWVEQDRRAEFDRAGHAQRCSWVWRRFTEVILEFGQQLPAAQYLELRYEDFVRNPKEEADRLLGFLGITATVSGKLFVEAVSRARTSSVGGWQRGFTPAQVQEIEQEAGALLRALGYS